MYDQSEGKLEPVESESELKTGMSVVLKNCLNCIKTHQLILIESNTNNPTCSCHSVWTAIPGPCHKNDRFWMFHNAINDKRLFKVVDENPIADIIKIKKERLV